MSGKGAAVFGSCLGANAGVLIVCAADDGSSIIGAGGAAGCGAGTGAGAGARAAHSFSKSRSITAFALV